MAAWRIPLKPYPHQLNAMTPALYFRPDIWASFSFPYCSPAPWSKPYERGRSLHGSERRVATLPRPEGEQGGHIATKVQIPRVQSEDGKVPMHHYISVERKNETP